MSGSLGAIFFFIKVRFNPGEFAGDLISAILYSDYFNARELGFRKYILDKYFNSKTKKNES